MYMSGLLRYNSNYPQFFHVMSFLLLLCTCSSFLCETARARMQLIKTAIHFLPKDSHFMSPKDDCNKSATKVHFLILLPLSLLQNHRFEGGDHREGLAQSVVFRPVVVVNGHARLKAPPAKFHPVSRLCHNMV